MTRIIKKFCMSAFEKEKDVLLLKGGRLFDSLSTPSYISLLGSND